MNETVERLTTYYNQSLKGEIARLVEPLGLTDDAKGLIMVLVDGRAKAIAFGDDAMQGMLAGIYKEGDPDLYEIGKFSVDSIVPQAAKLVVETLYGNWLPNDPPEGITLDTQGQS